MDLELLRKNIDDIDDRITKLFVERMLVVGDIKKAKKENSISVYDPERENSIKKRLTCSIPHEFEAYVDELYDKIFELSKKYQSQSDCGR